MAQSTDISSVIKTAIEREEEAYKFYTDVSKRARDKAVKDTFKELAKDELGHKSFLKNCQKDPGLLSKLPVPKDYKVSEATRSPNLSIDMKLADAIALAMKKEQEAAAFYQHLASTAMDSKFKETFLGLANMELGHKTRMENLFIEVGYPEVF